MTGDDITPEQASVLASWMVPPMLKLLKLCERMKAQQFPPDDPLYRKALAAYEAVRVLRLEIHQIENRGVLDPGGRKPGGS